MHDQMAWRSLASDDSEKILHLKIGDGEFAPFWEYPFALNLEKKGSADLMIQSLDVTAATGVPVEPLRHSNGWHCYQSLFKKGWEVVR